MLRSKIIIKMGSIFFRYRNHLFPTFVIFLFLFTRPAFFLGNAALDKFVVALGVIFILAGQAFRFLVIGFPYIKRGGKNGRVYADNLVTEGFYAHARNPMYVGNLFILAGLGIIYGSAWIYFLIIPFFSFAYLAIIAAEEDYLKNHFGREFKEYCRRVNRLIPNFKGVGETLRQFHYDWRKALRKDYNTFFGVIVGCSATILWKRYYFQGFTASKKGLFLSIFWFILIAAAYISVRYLKKSGRLKSL